MKKLAMAALGALMMAGGTVAATSPAEARVTIGIGFGGGGHYPARFCDPYSRYYDPYRCDEDRYYSDYYYDPIFFDGGWYRGPFRYRNWHGHREFFVGGGWHRNEWRGGRPSHFDFHDGWRGRDRDDRGGRGDWHDRGDHHRHH